MLFQHIMDGRTGEVGFGTFTNVSGQTITKGMAAYVATAAASNSGWAVTLAHTTVSLFQGIAESDIADTGVGRFISYGYAASTYVWNHAASVTIGVGEPMGGVASASLGVSSGGTGLAPAGYGPLVNLVAAGAAITSAGGYTQALVRAM